MKQFVTVLVAAALMLPALSSAEIIVGNASTDMLLVADTATGEMTDYVPIGTPHIVSLAYNAVENRLFCSDTSEGVNQILEVDPVTGSCSLVYQVPDMFIVFHSTSVDPATGDLYAIDQEHGELWRINVDEGTADHIGPLGVYWVTGADFDPFTGVLYACVGGLDSYGALYTIDLATGAATFVTETHRLMGIAFDEDGTLYGVNNYWYPDNPGFYRIDKNTGAWEEIGSYDDYRNLMSIEFLPLDAVPVGSSTFSGIKSLY